MATAPGRTGHILDEPRQLPDRDTYRRTMGRFPTGVAVLTLGCGPLTRAVTVNSVTSVSLDPLLLSVCLGDDSSILAPLLDAARFTVNLLSAGQREHSVRFAGRSRPDGTEATELLRGRPGGNGCLLVGAAVAALECRVAGSVPAGDHVIVLGRVEALHQGPADAEPLIFHRGTYRQLAEPATVLPTPHEGAL
ncbi:flavin reductase family protein [Winogradskya humida]|uniref:Flavin reductase n=1 Tax=Winogradskya humida TaxID=113566 RepID=A0ABQ3ZWS4_9ACTN|nr:flavin reductase family protein [Actinoplanes humidus]GIE23055.1 flavin reductase [Actinoplanes humidus]